MKQVAFRVDSSTQIGSGHLMRCLTLAGCFKGKVKITFITRDLAGNQNNLIKQSGFDLFVLPQAQAENLLAGYEQWLTVSPKTDAEQTIWILKELHSDCVIVDHYALDSDWERSMRPYVQKIMVIDDLANRKHDCDILLDQNYYHELEVRYEKLVPSHCKLLLGPQYMILRKEFYEARKNMRVRDGKIRNILAFFGGSDPTNETMKVLQAIINLNREDIIVNVVVGGSNQNKNVIQRFCDEHRNIVFHYNIDYMARLMNEADLAIGAGGSTTWERCYLGLPAIIIAVAENQVQSSKACGEIGVSVYIGKSRDVSGSEIEKVLANALEDSEMIKKLSNRLLDLLQGLKFHDTTHEILGYIYV